MSISFQSDYDTTTITMNDFQDEEKKLRIVSTIHCFGKSMVIDDTMNKAQVYTDHCPIEEKNRICLLSQHFYNQLKWMVKEKIISFYEDPFPLINELNGHSIYCELCKEDFAVIEISNQSTCFKCFSNQFKTNYGILCNETADSITADQSAVELCTILLKVDDEEIAIIKLLTTVETSLSDIHEYVDDNLNAWDVYDALENYEISVSRTILNSSFLSYQNVDSITTSSDVISSFQLTHIHISDNTNIYPADFSMDHDVLPNQLISVIVVSQDHQLEFLLVDLRHLGSRKEKRLYLQELKKQKIQDCLLNKDKTAYLRMLITYRYGQMLTIPYTTYETIGTYIIKAHLHCKDIIQK